jgi:hypothetical protein
MFGIGAADVLTGSRASHNIIGGTLHLGFSGVDMEACSECICARRSAGEIAVLFHGLASVDMGHYRPWYLTLGRFNLEWLTDVRDGIVRKD